MPELTRHGVRLHWSEVGADEDSNWRQELAHRAPAIAEFVTERVPA